MDDLASLRDRINSFAGYADESARRLADQQVRAYVGERLARLRERLAPAGESVEPLDRVIFRCEFADQRVLRAIDQARGSDPELTNRVLDLDRRLIDAADGAASVDAAGLAGYLVTIESMFDRRFSALTAAPSR